MSTLDRIAEFSATHTYGSVVNVDEYRLGQLAFVPDIIYDIGANRGMFTVWAKHLFPDAAVVAVEPEPENYATLCRVTEGLEGVTTMQAALGVAPIFFGRSESPGGHRFRCDAPGFPLERIRVMEQVDVRAVTLAELIEPGRSIVKIDIESAEMILLDDTASTEALRQVDYITMELHFWAATKELIDPTAARLMGWLGQFRYTHHVQIDANRSGGTAWLTRREE